MQIISKTVRGSIKHLTRDNTPNTILEIQVSDFPKCSYKDIRKYIGHPTHKIIACLLPVISTKKYLVVNTTRGNSKITVKDFCLICNEIEPEWIIIPYLKNERNNLLYFEEFFKWNTAKSKIFSVIEDDKTDVLIGRDYIPGLFDKSLMFNDDSEMQNLTESNSAATENGNLDLTSPEYKMDLNVLSDDCNCYSCSRKITRAYIYHLIICKEMLASVLIQMHNLEFLSSKSF